MHQYVCYRYIMGLVLETGTGSGITSQSSCHHIPVSTKMNVISSAADFKRWQVRHRNKVVHWGIALDYQQTGAFRSMLYAVEYAVDVLFFHRFESQRSWKVWQQLLSYQASPPYTGTIELQNCFLKKSWVYACSVVNSDSMRRISSIFISYV